MRPKRQILPFSGPRPAPISSENSFSSVFLTASSSTPAGHSTAFICGNW